MIGRWLGHRHLPWLLAGLAMLLCAPSLWLGWQLDDHFHRLALTEPEGSVLHRSPADMFVFIEGDEEANRRFVAAGMLPWWSHERLRIAFFRPLTGLSHWLDYRLWPELPVLMHLHSLLWFGAIVMAAALFYRRIFRGAWVAGLAALLFAVDDAHGWAAVWLANRNALLGVFFGLMTLIAHDHWRRDGQWAGAVLAPVALVLGVLAKESVAAVGAYLLAYALFLDRGRWLARLRSLAPYAVIGVSWWVIYKRMGYGTVGSGWYVEPGAEPLQFAQVAAVRVPLLLAWQWLVPCDLEWPLSPSAARVLWLAAMAFVAIVAAALLPLVTRDRVARFWALGMLLSLLPACIAFPHGRLLFFVGLGGMGLLAQFLGTVLQKRDRSPGWAWRRWPARVLVAILVVIHLGVAPVILARTAGTLERSERAIGQASESLPSDPGARFQTVLLVSTPTYATFGYSAMARLSQGRPYLCRTLVLGSGGRPIEMHRPDRQTLLLRPDDGFLTPLLNRQARREAERLLFDQRRVLHMFDGVYRDSSPMTPGQRVELLGVTVEVTAITDDGRPAEAAFRFAVELENLHFRWLQWKDGGYAPFAPPAVGHTVVLPAAATAYGSARKGT